MSTVAKVFVVLNLLLAVAFLGAAATHLGYDDSYRKKLTDVTAAKDQEIAKLNGIITESNREKANLSQQKNDATARADVANTRADAFKLAYDQIVTDHNKVQASYASATDALKTAMLTIKNYETLTTNLQNERTATLTALAAAQDAEVQARKNQATTELNLEQATSQLQDSNTKLATATADLESTRTKLEALIKQNPGSSINEAQPAQTAKILQADNAHNIFVISLGSEDGVRVGFKYTVARGNHYIGQIVIDRVEAKMASGSMVRGMSTGEIQQGDDVISR
jgi:chromosome segregation ATPase